MGNLWSRLRRGPKPRSEVSEASERRGRQRTRTPPAFRNHPKSGEDQSVGPGESEMLTAHLTNGAAPNGERPGNKSSVTPHEFVWKYGGNKVVLTGSFDNWSQSIPMKLDHLGLHRATVNLDPKKAWSFKFVVDGVWRCSLDFATETDATGNVNNIIHPE